MRMLEYKKLENVITKVFNRHYKKGLIKWVQDYEDASTELVILGQTTSNNDDTKKRCLVQNAQNIGMVDTVFEALVDDESCTHFNLLLLPRRIRSRQARRILSKFLKRIEPIPLTCQISMQKSKIL
jgi:hypothetical protein